MERVQSVKLNVRMEPSLRASITLIAAAKDRTVAWVVRDALKRYVQEERTPD
jgi:hypothetical protein